MKWIWPFKTSLQVRLLGPSAELLDSRDISTYGKHELPSGCELTWKPNGHEISLPVEARVLGDGEEIARKSFGSEIKLIFKQLPKNLVIQFPNSCELRLSEAKSSAWVPLSLVKTASFYFFVLLAHTVALAVVYFGAIEGLEIAQRKMEERLNQKQRIIEDVQALAPSPSRSAASGGARAPSASEREAARLNRLMGSWNAGKPVQSADEVLPADKPKAFGRNLDTQQARAWQDQEGDYEIESPDLNISDAQIFRAFSPITPRIKECYDDVLIRDSSLEGRPNIWIDIDLTGRVSGVQVDELKARKPESIQQFQTCLRSAYASVQLPKPNQAFSVNYRLFLQQLNTL